MIGFRRRCELVALVLLSVRCISCGDGSTSRSDFHTVPRATDPAFGFVGNILIADEGSTLDAQVDRMWVGFSGSSTSFEGILENKQELLAGKPLVVGGSVVPSRDHALNFYFDPVTTRTATTLDRGRTTLDALKTHPEDPKINPSDRFGRSWVEVKVEQIVETPATCGDGFVQLAEGCDPPGTPCRGRFEVASEARTCAGDCTCPSPCGDGVIDDPSEQCDDGNAIDGDGCSGCLLDPVQVTRDFATGLHEFTFRRTSGLGFCPQPGSLRHASVELGPDQRFHFAASIFGEFDGCIPTGLPPDDCPPAIPVPERTLSDPETESLMAAFTAVVVTQTPTLGCGSDDPCIIDRFSWTNATTDGQEILFAIDDDACAPRLLRDEAQRLIGTLENLARTSH